MHTNVLNTLNANLAPWTALSKELVAAQTSLFQSVTALNNKGYSKAAPEEMAELAVQAGSQGMAAGFKAARAAIAHAVKATKDLSKSTVATTALPGMEALQAAQAKATAAMTDSLDKMESLLSGVSRTARA